jgi:hypothetical protein
VDALDWKRFYAEERRALGERGLDALLDAAPVVPLGAALIFPHTRATTSGALVAAVARALVAARVDRVVALGVLHGARRQDAPLVQRAKAGDRDALAELRRVHPPGGHASEEFSLDTFESLLLRAAHRAGTRAPEIVARYPFLVGAEPESLPGLDELARLAERYPVVATADPVHHGHGYGTPDPLDPAELATWRWARSAIEAQLDALQRHTWADFTRAATQARSDFTHTGPVLACLRPQAHFQITQLQLVDYADVLQAAPPTWVAGALIGVSPRP